MPERKYILIVDDEEDVRRMILSKILLDYSERYDPLITVDGHEALALMKAKDIAAVVLDIRLPNLNGMEVCREVMADEKLRSIPIIVSSGFVRETEKEKLRSLGVKYFLDKPYPLDALFHKIDEVTGQN